jgi:mutator protein MutT
MYTIFKNESSVILSDSHLFSPSGEALRWTDENLKLVMTSLQRNEGRSFSLHGQDLDQMWQVFRGGFKVIEAAGGVVRNREGEILLIYRHDTWDLPKGKIDKGESREQAAVREVEEECGFTDLHLEEYLRNTYHIYEEKGKHILKVTYWFYMFSEQSDLKPQEEEGITALRWMRPEELGPVYENTYPNIRILLQDLGPA